MEDNLNQVNDISGDPGLINSNLDSNYTEAVVSSDSVKIDSAQNGGGGGGCENNNDNNNNNGNTDDSQYQNDQELKRDNCEGQQQGNDEQFKNENYDDNNGNNNNNNENENNDNNNNNSNNNNESGNNIMEPEQFRKVFIGGLSYKTDDDTLKNYFSKYGELVDYVVMKDSQTGRSRGFGFVTYSESFMVDELMKNRPHIIDGRQVEPKRATPREDSGKTEVQMTVKKLFIGGLRDNLTEEDLKSYFGQYGTVVEAVVMKEKESSKSRGFGFVTFDDYDPVDKIILEKHHTINGINVHTQKALPKDFEKGQGGGQNRQNGGQNNYRNNDNYNNGNNYNGNNYRNNNGNQMQRNNNNQYNNNMNSNSSLNNTYGSYNQAPSQPKMNLNQNNMQSMMNNPMMNNNNRMGGGGGMNGGMGGNKMGGGGPIRGGQGRFNNNRSSPYGGGGGGGNFNNNNNFNNRGRMSGGGGGGRGGGMGGQRNGNQRQNNQNGGAAGNGGSMN